MINFDMLIESCEASKIEYLNNIEQINKYELLFNKRVKAFQKTGNYEELFSIMKVLHHQNEFYEKNAEIIA